MQSLRSIINTQTMHYVPTPNTIKMYMNSLRYQVLNNVEELQEKLQNYLQNSRNFLGIIRMEGLPYR